MNRGGSGCLIWLLLAIGLVVAAYLTPGAWLPLIGRALNVSADVRPSDVIIVLGGGDGDRDQYASTLYRRGLAKEVIATGAPVGTATGATDLVTLGVPRDSIVLANGTQNTHDDAVHARQLMQQHGWKSALLVTDPYHARRSLWTFRTAFEGAGLEVSAAPVVGGWFDANHWWQTENGFVAVNEEYIKLVYYVARGYVKPSSVLPR
jgi:uncharacterized SAM-binding protein YcdF (DUF218 family)